MFSSRSQHLLVRDNHLSPLARLGSTHYYDYIITGEFYGSHFARKRNSQEIHWSLSHKKSQFYPLKIRLIDIMRSSMLYLSIYILSYLSLSLYVIRVCIGYLLHRYIFWLTFLVHILDPLECIDPEESTNRFRSTNVWIDSLRYWRDAIMPITVAKKYQFQSAMKVKQRLSHCSITHSSSSSSSSSRRPFLSFTSFAT